MEEMNTVLGKTAAPESLYGLCLHFSYCGEIFVCACVCVCVCGG